MQEENLPEGSSRSQNRIVGSRSCLNRLRTGQSGERLAAELDVYWIEIGHLKSMLEEANLEPSACGYDTLSGLLEESAFALKESNPLKESNLTKGWKAYNTARRIETEIYHQLSKDDKFEKLATEWLQAKAVSVYSEGMKKLRGWRKQAIKSLLSDNNQLKPEIRLSDLTQSERIINEHHSNIYRRLEIIQRQFRWLAGFAVIAIVSWVVLLAIKDQLFPSETQVYDLTLNIQTIIFGVLGACISGILTLANSSTRQNIPEKLLNSWVTFARPLVGLVSALAVVIFVLSGILEINKESHGLYLSAAFIAGFSERLLIKTIEGVVGKTDGSAKAGKEKTPSNTQ